MKIKKSKVFLNVIFFFLILVPNQLANSHNFIKKNTLPVNEMSKKKGVSKTTYSRIEGYLKGKFYSKNLNQNFFQVSGVYMAISEDGASSTISFCNADSFELCAEQHLSFQTLKRCEKISKEKCYLIFRGKVFLPLRKESFKTENFFYVKNQDLGKHSDIYGKTLEELNVPDD